jgi:transposase
MKRFIGIDLHKNMFVVCILTQDGQRRFRKYFLKGMENFIKELKETDILAVESTNNTRYFVEQVSPYVSEVKVINPLKFKVISSSVKKTDQADAEKIAFFLSKGMLPEIKLKSSKHSEISSLTHTRDKFVKLRTSLKNKIHNILVSYGIVTKKTSFNSNKGLQRVFEYDVSEIAMIELEVIVEQIRSLNKSIDRLDKEICEKGKELQGFENLVSIKGVGEKSAAILLSSIGDINNFESVKKLDAYFGLVPRLSQSNEKEHYGRITKKGNKLARTVLVQCAFVAIKYSNYLNTFYNKLKQKKGSGKAIIATARKLLGIIYNTLKNNWVFDDFPNFVIKTI